MPRPHREPIIVRQHKTPLELDPKFSALLLESMADGVFTLNERGEIGKVSGILAKAKATESAGMDLIVVPFGQKTYTIYSEEKSCDDYLVTKICRSVTRPEDVDVEEEVGIRVVESTNIQEALKYFLI